MHLVKTTKWYLHKFIRRCYHDALRKIISPNDSIICNNCFGARISQELGYVYNSPTAGLYIPYPDYVIFLTNLKNFLSQELQFSPMDTEKSELKGYPHGYIEYDNIRVNINFLHYQSNAEAREKWERRAKRVDFDHLFVIGSEMDGCTDNDIDNFVALPIKRKIFFTKTHRQRYANSNIVFCIPEMSKPNFTNLYGMAHLGYKFICKQSRIQ